MALSKSSISDLLTCNTNDAEDIEDVILLAFTAIYLKLKKLKGKRKFKVRELNRNRQALGFFQTVFLVMKYDYPEEFFKMTKMNLETFNKLLYLISPYLTRKKMSDSISPQQRLAVTLQ